MKVLHITNEFTKKNFSISSLIIYISNYLYKNYKFEYSILTSKLEVDLFKKKNIDILSFNSWLNFFNQKRLHDKIIQYDVVHIHGIWAPIQFISLLICNKMKINCIVHPHGMLLNEALKSAGFFKFILKYLSLFILKITIRENIKFISITNQETNAINRFFLKHQVTEIPNPIPFKFEDIKSDLKKKKIVYFGRIHPHKNIHLLIESFLVANLSNEWILEIYGIRDDEKYYKKLKKLINENTQVIIKDPVFGYKKQSIMKEAWVNILVSKSEVLSLSILESSALSLPSLVNKDIATKDIEESVISTDLSINDISKKIKEVSEWSLSEREKRGEMVMLNAQDKISIKKISTKYNLLYQEITSEDFATVVEDKKPIFDLSFLSVIRKNSNFLLVSSTYMFNLMFASLLVVALVVLGHYSIAGELGLITSFWITLTQIFSSNMRSIVVSEDNKLYAQMTLIYRFIFSVTALILFYNFFSFFISVDNQNLIYATSFLIMIQWVNEMNLVQYEIRDKLKLFKFFSIINTLTVFTTALVLYLSEFEYLTILLAINSIIVLFSLSKNLFMAMRAIIGINLTRIIKLNLQTIAFLSSFSIIISSFAWRIMIYYIFDKSLAGIFFACFSIGSFPGTLFNSVIGPAFIKQKISISNNFKKMSYVLFAIIFSSFLFSTYLLIKVVNVDFLGNQFIVFTASVSLMGSYFMSYAMYLRHKKIQLSFEERIYLFKRDILYGSSITFLIPILYFGGGTVLVSFSFLLASLIALFSYSIIITDKNRIRFKF